MCLGEERHAAPPIYLTASVNPANLKLRRMLTIKWRCVRIVCFLQLFSWCRWGIAIRRQKFCYQSNEISSCWRNAWHDLFMQYPILRLSCSSKYVHLRNRRSDKKQIIKVLKFPACINFFASESLVFEERQKFFETNFLCLPRECSV